jgi:hypothetical protein
MVLVCLTCLLQLLQLQQKQCALERQLKKPAPATGWSASTSPTRATNTDKPSAQRTPASHSKKPQHKTTKSSAAASAVAVAATSVVSEEGPGSPALSDITHNPDLGPSPADSPMHSSQPSGKAAAGGAKRAWPLVQQQQQQAPGFMQGQAVAASWPALCAELEGEVEMLKSALASREQEVGVPGGGLFHVTCSGVDICPT